MQCRHVHRQRRRRGLGPDLPQQVVLAREGGATDLTSDPLGPLPVGASCLVAETDSAGALSPGSCECRGTGSGAAGPGLVLLAALGLRRRRRG